MPLTTAQIKKLQVLSTSNFKKHECEQCNVEFYTVKENARYCTNACKQNAYRARLLNKENISEKSLSGTKTETVTPDEKQKGNIETTIIAENNKSYSKPKKVKQESLSTKHEELFHKYSQKK